MVTVNRSVKSYIPCWLIQSDLYPDGVAIPYDKVASTFRDTGGSTGLLSTTVFDRSYSTFFTLGGASFQWFGFQMQSGSSLYKCDQLAFHGTLANKVPVKTRLTGSGTFGQIVVNITNDMMAANSGSDYFTIPLDPEIPLTLFKFDPPSQPGSIRIREMLPMGGTRYYKRIYRKSDYSAFFYDKYGHQPLTVAENQIFSDSQILPDLPHTLTQVDELNWKATLNNAIGPAKTSWSQVEPRGLALTFAQATTLIAKHGATYATGTYWFKHGNSPVFATTMTSDGYFMIASSFADGRVAAMTNNGNNYLVQGFNEILPLSILSTLPISEVNISAPGKFRIRTTHQIIADRVKANQVLTQAAGDQGRWTLDAGNTVPISLDVTTGPPMDTLNNTIYYALGNVNGLFWVPKFRGAVTDTSGSAASKMQMLLLVK